MQTATANPLSKHFRQPKLYIKLPSGGNFYRPGSLVPEQTGEYPVYAMTAKDELMFKTPDALLNGQSTVNVCLLYTSPSPRDGLLSRMPSSA